MGGVWSCTSTSQSRDDELSPLPLPAAVSKPLATKEGSFPSNMLLLPEGFDASESSEASEEDSSQTYIDQEKPKKNKSRVTALSYETSAELPEPPHELIGASGMGGRLSSDVLMTPSQRPRFPLEFFVRFARFRVSLPD